MIPLKNNISTIITLPLDENSGYCIVFHHNQINGSQKNSKTMLIVSKNIIHDNEVLWKLMGVQWVLCVTVKHIICTILYQCSYRFLAVTIVYVCSLP